MTATYKIKLTRQTITDEWPLSYFLSDCLEEFHNDPTGWQNPISIPSFGFNVWPKTPGFVSYNYEEYDSVTDVIALDHINNGTDTPDQVNENQKMIYNPNSLTLTSIVTFDSLENLELFITICNTYWNEKISKSSVHSYLISKGMTLQEEIYIDGVLNTTIELRCFDFS